MYAQKTLATIRYKAVNTRSLNRVYFEEQNSILLPFDSLPSSFTSLPVDLFVVLLSQLAQCYNINLVGEGGRGGGGGGGGKNAEDVVDRKSE